MTKTQTISAKILAKLASGMSVRDAINSVLGAGAYEKLASDLYDDSKARG